MGTRFNLQGKKHRVQLRVAKLKEGGPLMGGRFVFKLLSYFVSELYFLNTHSNLYYDIEILS